MTPQGPSESVVEKAKAWESRDLTSNPSSHSLTVWQGPSQSWTSASLPTELGVGNIGWCLQLSSWPFHVDSLYVSLSFSPIQIPEPTGQAPWVLHLGKTPLGVWENIAERWGMIRAICTDFGTCTRVPVSNEIWERPGGACPISLGCLSHHLGWPQVVGWLHCQHHFWHLSYHFFFRAWISFKTSIAGSMSMQSIWWT